MACACTRPHPAIPIRNAFTGSLSLPSGPRPLPSGSHRAAWTRPRATEPRLPPRQVLSAGTSPSGAVRNLLRERAARPLRPFRSRVGSQRGGPRPLSGPAAGRRHRCMRSLSGNREECRTPSVYPGSRVCRREGRRQAPSCGPSALASCGRAGSGCGCSPHSGSDMPWISDFGSVFFRFPPPFESGQVKLPSAPAKAGRPSNLTACPNGTATAWPSAPMFMMECFFRTEARTACRRAHWPLPRRLNRIPCR